MIAFDSPEGIRLRAIGLSRSALMALWFTALNEGQDTWSAWALDLAKVNHPQDPTTIALRFLQASADGDAKLARQLWAVLASFPIDDSKSRIIQAAHGIGQSLLK